MATRHHDPTRYPVGARVALAELEDDPHPVLARLRAAEPVSYVPALGGFLVTRRDLAVAVMRDDAGFTVDDPRFSTARVVGPSMLSTDGAEHARHRAPFARPFRLDEVRRRLADAVEREVARLLDDLAPAGAAELRRGLCGPLAAATMAEALGLDRARVPEILVWYDAIVAAVSGVSAGAPVSAAGREAHAALADALGDAIAARPGSLLGVAAGEAAGLARDEVVANAAVLLFGGIETTEGMLATLLLHLLGAPEALAAIRDDPAQVAAAAEESLRLEPAAAVVDRYATRDHELGGAEIRRGDLVVVSLAGANRDPAAFGPDPDRFRPGRREARLHVAFAQGPHVCLGMHLARLEAAIAVPALLARLPALRLDPARPARVRGLVFRKPVDLHVRWG